MDLDFLCDSSSILNVDEDQGTFQDQFDDDSIYNYKSASNDFVRVTPPQLHFTFNSVNLRTLRKIIVISSCTIKPCPIQLLLSDTRYFKIENPLKNRYLHPFQNVKLKIAFTPDVIREYVSILMIRCNEGQHLKVKLSANPVYDLRFPKKIDFGNVPLGHTVHYVIWIYPIPEKKISFSLSLSRADSCIDIYPSSGNVRSSQKAVEVLIIYRPLKYITLNLDLQILIPELSEAPYEIKLLAVTKPELQRKPHEDVCKPSCTCKESKISKSEVTEFSTLLKKCLIPKNDVQSSCKEDLTYEQINLLDQSCTIPLFTLHAVNCILNTRPKKIHYVYELRGPLNIYMSETNQKKSEYQKEFLLKAEEYRNKNNKDRTYNKPKVGFIARHISNEIMKEILSKREESWINYENATTVTPHEKLIFRDKPLKIRQRVIKNIAEFSDMLSPSYVSDTLVISYPKIAIFVDIARKIILKNRLLNTLKNLKRLTPETVMKIEAIIAEEEEQMLREQEEKEKVMKHKNMSTQQLSKKKNALPKRKTKQA